MPSGKFETFQKALIKERSMEVEKFYPIFNRGNGDELLFRSEENYRFFLQQREKYIRPIATTYAYCLLPNHFHFLIQLHSEENEVLI